MRITRIEVVPFTDGRRLRVNLSLTPFQVRPNVDVELVSKAGEVVTGTSVVEVSHKDLELVLHLPAQAPEGTYTVRAVLYHHESDSGDSVETSVDVVQGMGHA